jgi:hypothetical protein
MKGHWHRYMRGRLRRQRPDLYKRVRTKEITVYRGALLAGFIHVSSINRERADERRHQRAHKRAQRAQTKRAGMSLDKRMREIVRRYRRKKSLHAEGARPPRVATDTDCR